MFSGSLIYPTAIILWMVFYTLFYQVLRRLIPVPSKIAKTEDPIKRGQQYSAHVFYHISLFHAVVNLAVSSYIFFSRPFNWLEINQTDTLHLLCFSVAYYISSSTMGQWYRFHAVSMVCHHAVVISEIFYAMVKTIYGNIILVGFAIAESSNPFRIIKNIADGHADQKKLGDYAIRAFAVVFLFCRYSDQPCFVPHAAVCGPSQQNHTLRQNERCGAV